MTRTLEELLGAIEDSDAVVRWTAARALGERVRCTAARALGEMDAMAVAGAAIPALSKALNDRDEVVRYCAVKALQKMGPAAVASSPALAEVAVPALAEALNNEDDVVRYWAARGLGAIGPKGVAAVPALRTALNDPDADVRSVSKWALGVIEGA